MPCGVRTFLGTVALGACGGADPHLEPRYVAVHNAMTAMGMAQSGAISEGSLPQGADARIAQQAARDDHKREEPGPEKHQVQSELAAGAVEGGALLVAQRIGDDKVSPARPGVAMTAGRDDDILPASPLIAHGPGLPARRQFRRPQFRSRARIEGAQI